MINSLNMIPFVAKEPRRPALRFKIEQPLYIMPGLTEALPNFCSEIVALIVTGKSFNLFLTDYKAISVAENQN